MLYKGAKIEVKSSAYIQRWYQKKPSAISWGIGESLPYDSKTGDYDERRIRLADCYVLCLYTETERDRANILDVSMWQFYVLSTVKINRVFGRQKRVGVAAIKRLTEPVGHSQLKERIERVLKDEASPASQ